ncbi:MAG: YwqG family protein [Archangium sp.]|nr:YwqG family protein [Archangium sp.]
MLGGLVAMSLKRDGKQVSFASLSSPREWETSLQEAGLSEEHAQALCAAGRYAAAVSLEAASGSVSKVGGKPHAPEGFSWPQADSGPFVFLAQLELAELTERCRGELGLPETGVLSVFMEAADDGICEAFIFDADQALAPTTNDQALELDESAIVLEELWTPPPIELAEQLLEDDEAFTRIYRAALDEHQQARSDRLSHQVGGHPHAVQYPPETEGERLLLQVDSEEDRGLMWGDLGRLYVLISSPGEFDNLRFDVQST